MATGMATPTGAVGEEVPLAGLKLIVALQEEEEEEED